MGVDGSINIVRTIEPVEPERHLAQWFILQFLYVLLDMQFWQYQNFFVKIHALYK